MWRIFCSNAERHRVTRSYMWLFLSFVRKTSPGWEVGISTYKVRILPKHQVQNGVSGIARAESRRLTHHFECLERDNWQDELILTAELERVDSEEAMKKKVFIRKHGADISIPWDKNFCHSLKKKLHSWTENKRVVMLYLALVLCLAMSVLGSGASVSSDQNRKLYDLNNFTTYSCKILQKSF